MKRCPFCAEEIQDAAIKCRWCGEMLDGSKRKTREADPDDVPYRPLVDPSTLSEEPEYRPLIDPATLSEEPSYRPVSSGMSSRASDGSIRCPKCGSSQVTGYARGFKVGRAVALSLIATPIVGLIGGAAGRRKVKISCMNCGHQWQP